MANPNPLSATPTAPIRMLRLAEVMHLTGLRKTKIYELQSQQKFPLRVPLAGHSVGWVESEVQEWLTQHAQARTPIPPRTPLQLVTPPAAALAGRAYR